MTERTNTQKRVQIFRAGIWKKISKKGNPYMSGSYQNYWINIFRNDDAGKSDQEADAFIKLKPKDADPAFAQAQEMSVNLYKRTSKAGLDYLRGIRGDMEYHLYVNTRKQSPNAPDYNLVVYDRQQDPVRHHEGTRTPEMPSSPLPEDSQGDIFEGPAQEAFDDEDIPF